MVEHKKWKTTERSIKGVKRAPQSQQKQQQNEDNKIISLSRHSSSHRMECALWSLEEMYVYSFFWMRLLCIWEWNSLNSRHLHIKCGVTMTKWYYTLVILMHEHLIHSQSDSTMSSWIFNGYENYNERKVHEDNKKKSTIGYYHHRWT